MQTNRLRNLRTLEVLTTCIVPEQQYYGENKLPQYVEQIFLD
jgi:hypothetical protein